MRFHDPYWLLMLLALPAWWYLRHRRSRALAVADGVGLDTLPRTWRDRLARGLPLLSAMVLLLAITALARPQLLERESHIIVHGVDLVAALDLSTSMLAQPARADAAPGVTLNRLETAKVVLDDFLRTRSGDRIGLVAFAARPYRAAPLTLDHEWLRATLATLQAGDIEDGTALGDALLTALNMLGDAQPPLVQERQGREPSRLAASQTVILLTDGRHNAGQVDPGTAAAVARRLGIRVHVVGIGTRGEAVIPVAHPLGGTLYRRVVVDLDETGLRTLAEATGGRYFRADDRDMLTTVLQHIDAMEKRTLEEQVSFHPRELYPALLLAALTLGALQGLVRTTWLRGVY